jgi:uncharacterized protein with beta-barrel porin domain
MHVRLSRAAAALSCASLFAFANVATADHRCKIIDHPTTISSDKTCVRVVRKVDGDVVNNATVGDDRKDRPGFFIGGRGLITGELVNNGTIKGGGDGLGALTLGQGGDVEGGIRNAGEIVSRHGNGINLGFRDPDRWWNREAAALTGDITNSGLIDGDDNGIAALYGTMTGRLVNQAGGVIKGGDVGVMIADSFGAWTGGIENAGEISGDDGAIVIQSHVFGGGLENDGALTAASGSAVVISDDVATFTGGIVNRGAIEGANGGIVIESALFGGGLSNAGSVEGGDVAVLIGGGAFGGGFANTGDIAGGATGVAMEAESFAGAFTNGGSIDGASAGGVLIVVGQWGLAENPADIFNASTGVISGGETGFALTAASVFGDFVNDGKIVGGGEETGAHIVAETYTGDIINNGELEAASNALRLQIAELTGEITNAGAIRATAPNGVAVRLDIGNGATFTNADGGLIFGDVDFGGPGTYAFVGHDGGVEGDVTGHGGGSLLAALASANDDGVTVEGGEQYFVLGAISNFLSFDINDGGVALMGARSIGDVNGPGYASQNIDALNVNAGGRLYLDDDTILNVGAFEQNANGEITFFLTAPSGTPTAGSDYGRVNASGAVTIDGKLSVILDPISFGGTTQHEFNYADIIKGASIDGTFDSTAVEGDSYFFKLSVTYGANALNLNVKRTPFDQVLCTELRNANSQSLGAALEAIFEAGDFTPEQEELFTFLAQLEDVCGGYFDLGGAVLADLNTIDIAGPWKSAVNDRLNSTGATSCVVAGDSWCFGRFAANETGATQVMTDASGEDPFAWLRTGVREEGLASVWGRLVGVQGDNRGRGGAAGSDFTVTGGIVGADYVFTPNFIAGVAAQWTTADVDFKQRVDTADVQSFEVGGYFSYGDADFCVNANASYIFHSFDTYRFPFGQGAHGDYDGRTISAYAEIGKVFETRDFRIEPVAALSFAGLETDAYREAGPAGGNLLIVEEAEHQALKSLIGARVALPIELESGRKLVPDARIMWGHEYLDDHATFSAALASAPGAPFTVRGQTFARDSLIVGSGVTVPLSGEAVIYADYDVALSADKTVQSLSVGGRLSW